MKRSRSDPRLKGIVPLLSLSDAVPDAVFGPTDLIREISRYGWIPTYWKLANLAALIARNDWSRVRACTSDLITRFVGHPDAFQRQVAQYVAAQPSKRIIANESVIYFLQAMTLLHGSSDEAADPPDGTLAFLLLVANDYACRWMKPDARELTQDERAVADTARASGFNRQPDMARSYVRTIFALERFQPRDAAWQVPATWQAFLHHSFGMSVREYVEQLAGPIFILAGTWGRADKSGAFNSPFVAEKSWLSNTPVDATLARSFIEEITLDRVTAVTRLRDELDPDGMPVGVSIFHTHPFVRLPGDRAVAASPTLVVEQLRGALWNKCRVAAELPANGGSPLRWLRAFGDVFELYCRWVGKLAADSPRFQGQLLLSETPGHHEIEDLVLVNRDATVLFSVKSSTMPLKSLKRATCRSDVVDWFEKRFFGESKQGAHAGFVRQLHNKIEQIRAGEHDEIPRNTRILPVIVTYDEIGADNLGMYRWFATRAKDHGLLQQKATRPVTFVHIDEFEELMALASHGYSITKIMLAKTRTQLDAETRFSVALKGYPAEKRKLVALEEVMRTEIQRLKVRLFGSHHGSDLVE